MTRHQDQNFAAVCIFLLAVASVQSTKLAHVPHRQLSHVFTSGVHHVETFVWAVKLDLETVHRSDVNSAADIVAEDTGLQNVGQIGALEGYYILEYPTKQEPHLNAWYDISHSLMGWQHPGNLSSKERSDHVLSVSDIHKQLDAHPFVRWYVQQRITMRFKRTVPLASGSLGGSLNRTERSHGHSQNAPLQFNDPLFHKQWHLVNRFRPGKDVNVTGIWQQNITGCGVTVAVIDDGLEWRNIDIRDNYNADGSFDLNSGDDDPSPNPAKATNHHGTRCAGEIAAIANNRVCGVGVAYGARVSGIRILDGPMTDVLEAKAFTKKYNDNDIYSCSWGPTDNGKTVDGPQHVAMAAMRHGVDYGRKGYGAIYVVASGNGGTAGDNCNYDGYANTIYTVTIGAVGEDGHMPYYGEECASMLAVTFSSGGIFNRNIVTTDWTLAGGKGCTETHTGTSAAAPIAAALIALMLEARPCLTWRDVQHIIAIAAVQVDMKGAKWMRNAAGLYHSLKHGFGLMTAWRLVNAAKVWQSVPWLTVYDSGNIKTAEAIVAGRSVNTQFSVTETMLRGYELHSLEYVHAVITLSHQHRGDVELVIVCPSGTSSVVGATRKLDDSKDGFKAWTFSTVRCWGESPVGNWTLIVTDKGSPHGKSRGELKNWRLKLYGSPMTPAEFQQRIKSVEEASSGEYLNASYVLPCPPPMVKTPMVQPIAEKMLKILSLSGVFVLLMALYETLEYAFCYDDEKGKQYRKWQRLRQQRETNGQNNLGISVDAEISQDPRVAESVRLLDAEEIPLETFVLHNGAVVNADDDDDDDLLLPTSNEAAVTVMSDSPAGQSVSSSRTGDCLT